MIALPATMLLLSSSLASESRPPGFHDWTDRALVDWYMNVTLRVYDPESDSILVYELTATNGHDSPRVAKITVTAPTRGDRAVIEHLDGGPQVDVQGNAQ